MTDTIKAKPGIMDIELYVGGKGHLDGIENIVKLSSNENPHGPSPLARKAAEKEAGFLHIYPTSDHSELHKAIAKAYDLNPDLMICSNGSDELITFLCTAFAGEGDEVLFTEHGFLMYRICAQTVGATPVEAPEKNRKTDVDALLDACTEKTKIVFVANPNNPTGTFVPIKELERLAEGIPKKAVLVLDSAYSEFVDGYDGGASMVENRTNVVMTRTFSKLFGLGGARIGWGYAPKNLLEVLLRIRGPFNVNSVALAAAKAAQEDVEYQQFCLADNRKWADYLVSELNAIDIQTDETHTNFVLARFADETEADAANEALMQNGLIVRGVKGYGLPECLRITVGKGVDCKRIITVLKQFKQGK